MKVEAGWRVPDGFFRGFELRVLGTGESRQVRDSRGDILELAGPLPDGLEGTSVELRSPEEPPVLAARLVTATPLGRELPEIAMRLATTRGTNALLERKGAATALFITRGFADLLLIGTQQRPDLFALDIEKSRPLFAEVVEVPERLAADGSVLVPLEAGPLRKEAGRLLAAGFESAAVALLHSYRNPAHEEELGRMLRVYPLRRPARAAPTTPPAGPLSSESLARKSAGRTSPPALVIT